MIIFFKYYIRPYYLDTDLIVALNYIINGKCLHIIHTSVCLHANDMTCHD